MTSIAETLVLLRGGCPGIGAATSRIPGQPPRTARLAEDEYVRDRQDSRRPGPAGAAAAARARLIEQIEGMENALALTRQAALDERGAAEADRRTSPVGPRPVPQAAWAAA